MFDAIAVPGELKGPVLKQALVGQSKKNLSVISAQDNARGVSSVIGPFLKFFVELQSPQSQDCSRSVPRRNAFEVMAAAQRQLDHKLTVHYFRTLSRTSLTLVELPLKNWIFKDAW